MVELVQINADQLRAELIQAIRGGGRLTALKKSGQRGWLKILKASPISQSTANRHERLFRHKDLVKYARSLKHAYEILEGVE